MIANLIKKIIFSLFLGLLLTIFIIQNNQDFKEIIKRKILIIAKESLGCIIDFDVSKVNLFFPSLELQNFIIKEQNNDNWSWNCKKIKINCSWIDLILYSKFNTDIDIHNFEANSDCSNHNIAILPHLKKLILSTDTTLPININKLRLIQSDLRLYDNDLGIKSNLNFNCEIKIKNDVTKIEIYLIKGEILKNDFLYSQNISGTIQIDIPNSFIPIISINGSCDLPFLKNEDNRCFFIGKWEQSNKFFKICSIDGKLIIGPIKIFEKNGKFNIDFESHFLLSHLQKIIKIPFDKFFEGDCVFKLKTDLENDEYQGQLIVSNPKLNFLSKELINLLKINFSKKNRIWNGTISIEKNNEFKFLGKWDWCEEKNDGNIAISNETKIILNDNWQIHVKNFLLDFKFNNDFKISSKYFINLNQIRLEKNIIAHGEIDYNTKTLYLNGYFGNQRYKLNCKFYPNLLLNFSYFNEDEKECIKIVFNNLKQIKSKIYFENIKNWLTDLLNQNLIGEGEIILEGKYENGIFNGKINLDHGNITIPKISNIINEIIGEFKIDFIDKKIILKDWLLKFYKGEIKCTNAVVIFDNKFNLKPIFIYSPISINNCFLNYKNDIFTTISGKIILQKLLEKNMSLNGYLIVENAKIKNNIFSDEFKLGATKNNYLSNINDDLELNLSILNKSSIKIKTPFINTKINLDLHLSKSLSNPNISGSIDLNGGIIFFPYKYLKITSGNILFLSSQDPIITLIARNKIKEYNIIMRITGSAQDQIIKLESNPPLSEEQIASLLLVGSENGSMNMIMPALIAQNIKNIITGSASAHKKLKKYFNFLLRPLSHIRFVPSFSNESGRGGFKGAIEVDVNDRLSALIEKNFALSEDTKFQVDYLLTDEISLRGIKDERGDLGGEMEMRWKF